MSSIIVNNQSESIPRIAFYKKSFLYQSLGLIAWKVVSPSRGGSCTIDIPTQFEVYVSTGNENDPSGGCRTKSLSLPTVTGAFNVLSQPVDDQTSYVPDVVQVQEGVVPNEIQIRNNFSSAVWGHIMLDGTDVYAPQLISPGEVLLADVRPSFWAAHVSEFVRKGSRLVEAEMSATATEVLLGQQLTITGSRMKGFIFTVT